MILAYLSGPVKLKGPLFYPTREGYINLSENTYYILFCRLFFGYTSLAQIELVELWTLLWIVLLTDYLVKFATMILKGVVAMLSTKYIAHQRSVSVSPSRFAILSSVGRAL